MSEPRNCFIYVLCFDTHLAHAKHYVGCTAALRQRLRTHALGHGSRLTRELHAQGITWKLGGLFAVSMAEMRRLERSVKDYHNTAQFCALCQGAGRQRSFSRKATMLSLDLVPFDATSQQLGQEVTINTYTPADLESMEAVKQIMKTERDALGFVPIGTVKGMEYQAERGNVWIAREDGRAIGYVYSTYDPREQELTIHQTCVLDDARFRGHGRSLVENLVQSKATAKKVVAKVRDDLAANHFWQAIGFTIAEGKAHRTSNSLIHHYERSLEQ